MPRPTLGPPPVEGTLWAALDNGDIARLDRSGWHLDGRESGLETQRFYRVVELPDRIGGWELWALYRAKTEGRNCTRVA